MPRITEPISAGVKPIGGFFGMEEGMGRPVPQTNSMLALSSGRACLHYILLRLKPSCVYVPNYTCDALLVPFIENKIKFKFYSINEDLEPERNVRPAKGEYFLYVNYFGLKDNHIKKLYKSLGSTLIVDNTQAFYSKGYKNAYAFNCARKWFGVPDGAFLSGPVLGKEKFRRNKEISVKHLLSRKRGDLVNGYRQFLEYEETITSDLKRISLLSEKLLAGVDQAACINARRKNFLTLHRHFRHLNKLPASLSKGAVPFCYPFLPSAGVDRQRLAASKIFIPAFWKDVLSRDGANRFEKTLSTVLLPLPVDQRYDQQDMERMAGIIKENL